MKNSQTHKNLVLALFIVLFSCSFTLRADNKPKDLGLRVVCIDPGHGGKDAGCISPDKKFKEKDIVLSIGKKLAAKIKAAYPSVKVVMTRSDDRFIELVERAAIANRNNANLFISIHVNSVSLKSKNAKYANGFSIHTLGQSSIKNRDLFRANMELCKRENSVIYLEDDYTTTYQGFDPSDPESFIFFNLIQNANLEHSLVFAEDVDNQMKKGPIYTNRGISQDPFLVLWKTKMPSVLIETGFITNSKDIKSLGSNTGQNAIANNIFNAFVTFKKRYDRSLNIKVEEPLLSNVPNDSIEGTSNNSTVKDNPKAESQNVLGTVHYGIQVLATTKNMSLKDKYFRGYEVECISVGRLKKYIISPDKSLEKVRKVNKEVKKYFPDSFVVQVDGKNLKRIK